jgi:hypothetical protein
MLNPLKSGFYAVQLISHKLLRYAVPVFLALILFSTAVLAAHSIFYSLIFLFQTAFYLMAFAAWLLERSGVKLGILAMPLYFVLANIASVIAFYKFLRGERYTRWEPIREKINRGDAEPRREIQTG